MDTESDSKDLDMSNMHREANIYIYTHTIKYITIQSNIMRDVLHL